MEGGGNNWNDNSSKGPFNEVDGANRSNGHSTNTTIASSAQSVGSTVVNTFQSNALSTRLNDPGNEQYQSEMGTFARDWQEDEDNVLLHDRMTKQTELAAATYQFTPSPSLADDCNGNKEPNGKKHDERANMEVVKESEVVVAKDNNKNNHGNGTRQVYLVDEMMQKEEFISTHPPHRHFEQEMLQKDASIQANATGTAVLFDPKQRHTGTSVPLTHQYGEPQQQQQQQQQQLQGALRQAPEDGDEEEMIPGAYALAPLTSRRRRNPPPEAAAVDPQAASGSNHHQDNAGLAVANLVTEEDPEGGQRNRPLADPVNLEELQHKQAKQKKQQRTFLLILALVVLAGGTIIGTLVGTTASNKSQNNQAMLPTGVPTTAYDFGSIMEPSSVPSSAPTGILDYLLTNLPNDTVASLQEFGTPQWKAWDWLANHQNITYLPEWRKMQVFALATFFYSFEGENWKELIKERWMDETLDECLWFSSGFGAFDGGNYVALNGSTPSCNHLGQFTSLYLQDLQLFDTNPRIPPEIALLTNLSQVRLRVNDMAGSWSEFFPSVFYKMHQLQVLDFTANALSGSLPTELGQLTNLLFFNVVQNQLTGPLISELGHLTALEFLDLALNLFTGSVPTEVGQLAVLETLYLYVCPVQGKIPSELGELAALKELSISENHLSGQIPTEFGHLSALKMLHLHLNQISGPVPTVIGRLSSLNLLYLTHTLLSGELPTELWSMPNLVQLDVSNNAITGTLASEMGLLTALQQLDLSNNQLQGAIPSEIGLMVSLERLNLFNNSLTGILPSQLNGSMGLRLDGNQFSGSVPEHLCAVFWCDCSADEISVSSCADLGSLSWPGRFPPGSNGGSSDVATIVFNFQTDEYPADNYWVWEQQESNTTGLWTTTLQNSGGDLLLPRHLYSHMLVLNSNSQYKLLISDAYGDGILYGTPGWVTLTAVNQTVLYSFTNETQFTQLTVNIAVGADGQVEATGDIYCDPQYEQCRFGWG